MEDHGRARDGRCPGDGQRRRRCLGRPRRRTPNPADAPPGWAPPSWDDVVTQHSAPRLPARLPADRQPPRRRGPHPGGLRPGVPVALVSTRRAPSRAGCTGSRPTSSSTRCAARQRIRFDGLPDDAADRLAGREPAPAQAYDAAHFDDDVQAALDALLARVPRRRGARATSRASPTRRSRRRSASSSAPCAAASTAAAPAARGARAPRHRRDPTPPLVARSTGRPGGERARAAPR